MFYPFPSKASALAFAEAIWRLMSPVMDDPRDVTTMCGVVEEDTGGLIYLKVEDDEVLVSTDIDEATINAAVDVIERAEDLL